MNAEQRTSNVELGLLQVSLRSIVVLMFSVLFLGTSRSQSLDLIYDGLDNATSLYITQNSIYVVEQGKNRLLKLDHSGKLIETIGGKGSGNYQFSKPVDVDATNGLKIFVTDYNNRRVQVFDKRGQYLSSIAGKGTFGIARRYNPTQIAVNGLGEVFFVDEVERYIRRFDLDSNLADEFQIPSEVEQVDELVVTSRDLFILDKSTETIHRLALNGNYQGFYPAEGVHALFASESGIWKAYSEYAEFENRSKQKNVIQFNFKVLPVDMQVMNQQVFILTERELFRISIQQE